LDHNQKIGFWVGFQLEPKEDMTADLKINKRRKENNMKNELPTVYQQYIAISRYARYLDESGRRETWSETVNRYFEFFKKRTDNNKKIPWKELQDAVLNLEVMPSMRALMTAGPALEKDNVAGYNCSYVVIDSQKAFDEIMYILCCGTGVGFSVESRYTNKLPEVPDELHPTDTTIMFKDSKIGWATGYREFVSLLYSGKIPQWDISKLRPAGERLKTFGGRASGPEPLVDLLKFTLNIFNKARGRKLTTLECHDIVCKIADIVVCGGVRRSALISLSDLNDDYIRNSKSGEWWTHNGQRSLANNSAVYEQRPDMDTFMKEWVALYMSRSGERGLFSRVASQAAAAKYGRRDPKLDYGTNPCSEIILRPYQFCNLSEVVVRAEDTLETLKRKVKLATILGTLQSTLSDFRYINKKWKNNTEEERLLGVSLTGIMDHKTLNGSVNFSSSGQNEELARWLTEMRELAVKTNVDLSKALGVEAAAAITCVKPSGCADIDTKIKTSNGIMTIEEIFEHMGYDIQNCNQGDWLEPTKDLLVYDENDELKPITKLFVNGFAETYEVSDENGNTYKFTAEHKVKVTGKGWVRVDELSEGDDVVKF
jgi:ribonucleoside-diphosphate reductase alpha chain